MIIGLTGYLGSGKDEAAKLLIHKYGFKRIAFADELKKALLILNPILSYKDKEIRLTDAIKEYGDETKNVYPEYRRLLQIMGTEVIRNMFGKNAWIDLAFKKIKNNENIVITDVRFPNEAEAIHNHKGEVWLIKRSNNYLKSNHDSEVLIDKLPYDYIIWNRKDIKELYKNVEDAYEHIYNKFSTENTNEDWSNLVKNIWNNFWIRHT